MPSTAVTNSNMRWLIALFWLFAVVLGAFHAWDARHHMNADGISYLDVGDAYFRGDWKMAINAYWGPLYSWLLGLAMIVIKPSSYYEFTVVHLVNFVIFLFTLGCFHFFLMQLINYHQFRMGKASGNFGVTLPEWAWIALGYSLFLRSSLNLITIASVTPDMCVAAFVYLASGILLRIRIGSTNYFTFALLGIVLGFGYLAKAAMFPLALVFLSLSVLSTGNLRLGLARVIIAIVIFLSITSPFIFAISSAKGRFTFGDSGKYNYWWHVNRNYTFHWDGTPPGSGTPMHPNRKIFHAPAIYEFGTPIGGTYPVWYDPSYWNEGIKIHLDLKNQLRIIKNELKGYFEILYPDYGVLFFCSFILYLMGHRRWLAVKDIAEHWSLFIPAVIALCMYSLVAVDYRYVAPFFTLLWLGIFSGIRLPDSVESKRLLRSVTIVIVIAMMITTTRNLIQFKTPLSHTHWQVADALNKMGVLPGDKVARIGGSHAYFWARLAKVRIVAEIPDKETDNFWKAESPVKSNVIKTFGKTGAKVIVTNRIPSDVSPVGWQRIGNTNYYANMLSK